MSVLNLYKSINGYKMDQTLFGWVSLVIICSGACYLFGKYTESKKNVKQPYSELDTEDNDHISQKVIKNIQYYHKELEREKATKKRMVEEYEHEINFLKFSLEEAKINYTKKLVKFN